MIQRDPKLASCGLLAESSLICHYSLSLTAADYDRTARIGERQIRLALKTVIVPEFYAAKRAHNNL